MFVRWHSLVLAFVALERGVLAHAGHPKVTSVTTGVVNIVSQKRS